MTTLTDSQKETLEQYLSPDEETIEIQASDSEVIAVTDRRIITIEDGMKDTRDQRKVQSRIITGPEISGVTVDKVDGTDYDVDNFVWGVVLAAAGGAMIVQGGLLLMVFGTGVLGVGIIAMYSGLNRGTSGDLEVVIHKHNGDDESIDLATSEVSIATAISEAVGSAHPPRQ